MIRYVDVMTKRESISKRKMVEDQENMISKMFKDLKISIFQSFNIKIAFRLVEERSEEPSMLRNPIRSRKLGFYNSINGQSL